MEAVVKPDGRVVGINGAGYGRTFDPQARLVPIVDCDISHLYDDDGAFIGKVTIEDFEIDNVRMNAQNAAIEREKRINAARIALKERGPITNEETIAALRERLALIQEILGI